MIKPTERELYLEEIIIKQKLQLDKYHSLEKLLGQLLEGIREPKTVTCKYKQMTGHSRKRRRGKPCPSNCQIPAHRKWGDGCQNAHWIETKRKKEK